MKFYNVLISGLLSFSVLTSSSMTAVAVENKSHNENSYPMAMTSSEISDFLEEAVPAPIPESKIKDVNLFTKERTGSYTYDLDTKELEYSSFTASDFTCDTQSSQSYIPDELMSQSGLIENGDQINGIVGSDEVLPHLSVSRLNSNHKLSCQKPAPTPSVHSSLYHFQLAVGPFNETIGKR